MVAAAPTASALCSCYTPDPVAHAGGNEHYDPNTRKAFQDSMRHGVKIIENDVRFTKDDVPVVIHDPTVDTTTNGHGNVADLTLDQLRKARTPDGQYIPTLYEFLNDGKPYGVQYFVELKVNPDATQWDKFNARFDWLGVKNKTVVTSFDKPTLLEAKSYGYKTGWIDELGDRDPKDIKPYGDYYFKHHWSVTYDRLVKWNNAGLKVYAWTSDYSDQWQRFKSYEGLVQGVITNKPDSYLAWAH